jgi:hypothetical protein
MRQTVGAAAQPDVQPTTGHRPTLLLDRRDQSEGFRLRPAQDRSEEISHDFERRILVIVNNKLRFADTNRHITHQAILLVFKMAD